MNKAEILEDFDKVVKEMKENLNDPKKWEEKAKYFKFLQKVIKDYEKLNMI